jgi:hypothetical protein
MNNISNINFYTNYACCEEMLIEITLIMLLSDKKHENNC